MKAIVQDRYGTADVLRLREIDTPMPGDDEVLVRARAASLHPDVWHVMSGRPLVLRLMGAGLRKPKNPVPGTDVAGQVEAVGKGVTRFKPGDEVFGESIRGYQWANGGAFAEYVCAPQECLALKPANVTFAQAAAVPTSGLIALQGLFSQGSLRAGQKVLINGAGGGVGSIAVQLAKADGAEVTGVDHPEKLETIRALGADHVIDASREDITHPGARYDLILDIPGNRSFSAWRRALVPTGKYVLIGHDHYGQAGRQILGSLPLFLKLTVMSAYVSQLPKVGFKLPSKQERLEVLRQHMAAGRLTPMVDRTYPLAEVSEAIRYLQAGKVRGKVVITI